ncbi:hypothetical protein B4147_5694 [Bacillus wiedmannii]|uniref:Uncharacterized protein n=1 Tax=Bacillus wiedmannii TaxID=1890302 RepID=A0A0G8C3S5_9BACI|nr:hypothetical protein B4147_5694 [Bacillus wiedmannii]
MIIVGRSVAFPSFHVFVPSTFVLPTFVFVISVPFTLDSYPGTACSFTSYLYAAPSASYAWSFSNVYFHSVAAVTSFVSTTFPFCKRSTLIISGRSVALSSFHVFVPSTFVSPTFVFVMSVPFTLDSYPGTACSFTSYLYALPSASYAAKSLNSYFQSVALLTSFVAITAPFCKRSTLIISGRSFALSSFHVFVPSTFVLPTFVFVMS